MNRSILYRVMSRGFVTIATGDRVYYEMALNLLLSYRYYAVHQLPFAIICDKENDITAEFDSVVLLGNPKHSFLDKLSLPSLVPYDENIFIDADSLAYRDLGGLFDVFSGCSAFSYAGTIYPIGSNMG